MGWPYQFLNLDEAERNARRLTLDRYASYAQLSSLIPIALVLLYRAARWAAKAANSRRGAYDAIPNSPALKFERETNSGGWKAQVNKLRWWLAGDVELFGQLHGQRDQWVFGGLWTIWLLYLCTAETGQDYLHFTKRLGIVAASQFPLQYLLSLKALNPFSWIFRSSHEQVNRWHRPMGRIVYFLLCLHAAFYLNYFIGVGVLSKRLSTPLVLAGVLAFICMSILMFTTLQSIRNFSYRLFFLTHLLTVVAMPLLLFFHAHSGRTFMVITFIIFMLDLITRKIDTVTSLATLETIPGTNLVKIVLSLPYHKINRFRTTPGAHIYLSIPAVARPDSNPASAAFLLFEFLFNPFTVAAVDDENGDLTLVARHRGGPITSALARFAGIKPANTMSQSTIVSREDGKIPLCIEGPYGMVKHFPNLAGGDFDRILLVAGGIGATFTVPLYRSIIHDSPNARVEMVWAVRTAGEATWALTGTGKGKSILDDENVHIFLTGDILGSSNNSGAAAKSRAAPTRSSRVGAEGGSSASAANGDAIGDGEVEMSAMYRDRRKGGKYTANHNRKRPDLRKIVDDTFKHGAGERVAVVVCGPEEMGRELREYVGFWVMKGREVFWHNEGFGW
ncbi:ferric reductase like transmembrane component-domain-containing protein [Coniochaeta sp. 2T2.1]|nr:ferric reductase like transmembrane component-domain-containing protein [Coniochaeta sp. 2T2.1]